MSALSSASRGAQGRALTRAGLFYILSLLYSIQNLNATINSSVGQPVIQIFIDVFGETGGLAAFSIILVVRPSSWIALMSRSVSGTAAYSL